MSVIDYPSMTALDYAPMDVDTNESGWEARGTRQDSGQYHLVGGKKYRCPLVPVAL